MKKITLDEAVGHILDSYALCIGDVIFPTPHIYDDGLSFCMPLGDSELAREGWFARKDNKEASIKDSSITLIDTNGEEVEIVLLVLKQVL